MSVIANVLESYEVVRRQLLHLNEILTPECEFILVDDGSVPSLQEVCRSVPKRFQFRIHCTNDYRPWTQPRARNIGARLARTDKLLFFDIDHILTEAIIANCLAYEGDKLHWFRRPAILDANGQITTDPGALGSYGQVKGFYSIHWNSFLIRKEIFDRLGGYDETFCGRYGGEDIEFNDRYDRMCGRGLVRPAEVQGEGFVFPDPAKNQQLFHSLSRR